MNYTTGTSTSTTGDVTWQYTEPIQYQPPDAIPSVWVEAKQPERKNMRYLFRITVVDPKTELLILQPYVVAKDRSEALLKAKFTDEIRAKADDYDFLIEQVGEVRAKRETQKVKVVKDDE